MSNSTESQDFKKEAYQGAPEEGFQQEPCATEQDALKEAENNQEGEKEQEEDSNSKYLRLMADFQNFKRRTEKEKADIYAFANEKLVIGLLDVIDDFERALSHEQDATDSFAEGMRMIFKNFKGVLEKSGMEEIEALGIKFDPNVHNAVMTEATEEYDSGIVSDVMQKGYKLNKKVIRPSMVKVSE